MFVCFHELLNQRYFSELVTTFLFEQLKCQLSSIYKTRWTILTLLVHNLVILYQNFVLIYVKAAYLYKLLLKLYQITDSFIVYYSCTELICNVDFLCFEVNMDLISQRYHSVSSFPIRLGKMLLVVFRRLSLMLGILTKCSVVFRNQWTCANCLWIENILKFKCFHCDRISFFKANVLSNVELSYNVRIKNFRRTGGSLELYNINTLSIFSKVWVNYVLMITKSFFSCHEFFDIQSQYSLNCSKIVENRQ